MLYEVITITGNTVRFTKRNFKHSRNFVISLISCLLLSCQAADKQENQIKEVRVVIENQGWKLVGDLCLPPSEKSLPVVLMLNKADGDRTVYKGLAEQLAERGFASLRLDLRGHGEIV